MSVTALVKIVTQYIFSYFLGQSLDSNIMILKEWMTFNILSAGLGGAIGTIIEIWDWFFSYSG